jgi:hypothetical protein
VSALVLGACNLLEHIPVLVEACEISTDTGRRKLKALECARCDKDRNKRGAELHGDLRALPLAGRKSKLARLVYKTRKHWLRLSESFDDGLKLLASCEKMALEGIVSKRRDFPYRSGDQSDWIKVKCDAWREANKDRGDLFNKEKRR